MKVAVQFFLALCFTLLGGTVSAPAGAANCNSVLLPSRSFEKAAPAAIAGMLPAYHASENGSRDEETDRLVSIEDEDDEEDAARALIVLEKYVVAYTYALIARRPCTSAARPLSYYKHFSYLGSSRYIVQRAIRI
jgi:hypothetical protein